MDIVSQIRVGHVLFAGAMTGSMFVLGISAFYLLVKRDRGFALRSMAIVVAFGFISLLTVAFFGDQNGLVVKKYEPEKMAAIEAVWTTPKPPAAWSIIAWPSQSQEKNLFAITVPYGLSLIATHSLTGTVEGEREIIAKNKTKVEKGIKAYAALKKMRAGKASAADMAVYKKYSKDIGYALILLRYAPSIINATPAQIDQAAKGTIPNVFTTFYSFRFMVGAWSLMLAILFFGVIFAYRKTFHKYRWWLWCALLGIPLPYIASEFGWITAEVGRQPWTVHGFLPTYFSTSSLDVASVAFSLGGFALFYGLLLVVELYLMVKFARLGPSSLGEGRYHFEKSGGNYPQENA